MSSLFFLFILKFLITEISCDSCSDKHPTKPSDCTEHSISGGYCCFIQSPGYYPFEMGCVTIKEDEYRKKNEYWDGNSRWRLQCADGIKYKKKKYEKCGADHPVNAIDCWKYSDEHNSCCYTEVQKPWCYTTGESESGVDCTADSPTLIKKTVSECRWYKKKQNNFTHDDNKNIPEGQKYWCSSAFNYISKMLIGILILILL